MVSLHILALIRIVHNFKPNIFKCSIIIGVVFKVTAPVQTLQYFVVIRLARKYYGINYRS